MGNHTIAASYAGDANVAPSTGILMQTVNLAATTTALTVSTNSSLYGQAVTFTATVASPAGTPTGTVTFANDGNALGTVGLTNGQTTVTTSALPIGDHTIAASYTGDANFVASSANQFFTVNGITYSTSSMTTIPKTLTITQLKDVYNCRKRHHRAVTAAVRLERPEALPGRTGLHRCSRIHLPA
jgi:hypothetical protein